MRRPMRMAGPDIVLLVVGALVFGGATYAIAKQPGGLTGNASAAGVFTVTFVTSEAEGGEADVGSFRQASTTFDLEDRNVSRVTFDVVCSDPATAAVPFVIQLTVTPPAGIPAPEPKSGNCGSAITVDVPIADVPETASVPGTLEEDARANLAEFPNATRAIGTWTIDVSGARQGGPAGALPIPAGDPSGAIALTIESWEPRFAPIQR